MIWPNEVDFSILTKYLKTEFQPPFISYSIMALIAADGNLTPAKLSFDYNRKFFPKKSKVNRII